jgi:phenylalanine-4-hydroxylase
MKQHYDLYDEKDLLVWKTLFDRQTENLSDKASLHYLSCLNEISGVLNNREIPNFDYLNKFLLERTGWEIEVVPGLIPVHDFFYLMSKRKFCSSTWLRKIEQLDYLEEPDMFHDIYGHIPLLADKRYADLMQRIGALGVKFSDNSNIIEGLERFYWFTIEFGLIRELGVNKIYGAGIISSFGESKHIYNEGVDIRPFDIIQILETDFDKSSIQNLYYVIDGFDQLDNALDTLISAFKKELEI